MEEEIKALQKVKLNWKEDLEDLSKYISSNLEGFSLRRITHR